jgi:TIR domain-containing protein
MTQYQNSVFISYAWGGEREEIVNQIDESLRARGVKIIRDKRDLGYKGSIKEFMERIGQGNCVIVVVSDKYLRSPNCMFELVEIAENKQFHDRIFPILLADADIYDPVKRINYIKHWEQKRAQLAEAIKSVDPANLHGIREEMDIYDRIRDQVSGLTSTLKDMNTLTPDMHRDANFTQLYDALEKRMKEVSTNENLPYQYPISRHDTKQESIEQKRALDAAIAKHVFVGKSTEVITLVRMLDSDGLRAILQVEFEDLNLSQEDIITKSFSLDFPIDSSGNPLPSGIIMEIDAPDFEPKLIHKNIRIPPHGDAEPITCLLTPLYAGDLRVNISLYKDDLFIASRVLKTMGEETFRKDKPSPYVLVTIPLNLISKVLNGVPNEIRPKEIGGNVTNIYIGGNVEGSNIVSGDNNVITQRIQESFNKAEAADIQSELKATLKQLADAVAVLTKSLPAEQAAEVTDDLSKLVDEATKPTPSKKWYSISIDGLIKAAENVEKVGEPVINLSRKVLSLLMGGVIK